MKFNRRVLVSVICGCMAACGSSVYANDPVENSENSPVAVISDSNDAPAPAAIEGISLDMQNVSIPTIPVKVSLNSEFEKASINMMNSLSGFMNQMSTNLAAANTGLDSQSSTPVITQEDYEKDKSKFYPACVLLKDDNIDISKKNIYYTIHWNETLGDVARKLLGSVDKANVISDIPENQKVISSTSSKDYLPEGECLIINQPTDADFILYYRDDQENYYSLARRFYGSWLYGTALANFNGDSYPSSTYEKVIKLPKKLYLASYLVDSGETLSKVSQKLFGTYEYSALIAELNGLTDINKPLKRETCLVIPNVGQNFKML